MESVAGDAPLALHYKRVGGTKNICQIKRMH